MTPAPTLAWHFAGDTQPCESGLHAYPRILDAINHALGDILCRVECGGTIVPHGGGKVVASKRTILWRLDAAPLLRLFARQCALNVAHLWNAPAIVLDYLRTGDEALRITALDAVWSVARSAEGAAWSEAGEAAWAAGWAAGDDVVWAAAGAAWSAIRTDPGAAAEAAQEARLVAMAEAAHASEDT